MLGCHPADLSAMERQSRDWVLLLIACGVSEPDTATVQGQ